MHGLCPCSENGGHVLFLNKTHSGPLDKHIYVDIQPYRPLLLLVQVTIQDYRFFSMSQVDMGEQRGHQPFGANALQTTLNISASLKNAISGGTTIKPELDFNY